jgi:hypothetical protein
MQKTLVQTAAGFLALVALVGCGTSPSAPETPKRQQVPANRLQNGQLGQPGFADQMGQPGGAGGAQAAQALLATVRRANAQNKGFTAMVDTWEKGNGKTESGTLKLAFKKPSTLRLTIAKSTNSQATGVKLRWDGGKEFKIKPTWMPFSVGVGIEDKRVVSLNNWTIKETDVTCILNVLLDPATQVKALGEQNFDGVMMPAIEAVSPKSPRGVTREVIGIDKVTGLPKARQLYKGQTLVYKLMVKQMTMKTPSESELEM